MLNKEQAKQLAGTAMLQNWKGDIDELEIIDELTIEKPYGWIFFYHSKYGRDLWGNGPIVVEKETGKVVRIGTGLAIDDLIKSYEASRYNNLI